MFVFFVYIQVERRLIAATCILDPCILVTKQAVDIENRDYQESKKNSTSLKVITVRTYMDHGSQREIYKK